jgi:hypothetical protein
MGSPVSEIAARRGKDKSQSSRARPVFVARTRFPSPPAAYSARAACWTGARAAGSAAIGTPAISLTSLSTIARAKSE